MFDKIKEFITNAREAIRDFFANVFGMTPVDDYITENAPAPEEYQEPESNEKEKNTAEEQHENEQTKEEEPEFAAEEAPTKDGSENDFPDTPYGAEKNPSAEHSDSKDTKEREPQSTASNNTEGSSSNSSSETDRAASDNEQAQKSAENQPKSQAPIYWQIDDKGTLRLSGQPKEGYKEANSQEIAAFGPPWKTQINEVLSVEIESKIAPTSTAEWFAGGANIKNILGMENLDTSATVNMDYMFDGCSSLTNIDLSHMNTPALKSMSGMFNECRSLQSIDLSKINTSNVIDMSNLFNGCVSVMNVNVDNFDNRKCLDMTNTFDGLPERVRNECLITIAQKAIEREREAAKPVQGKTYWAIDEDGNVHLSGVKHDGYKEVNEEEIASGLVPPWHSSHASKVIIDSPIKPTSMAHWFDGMENLSKIKGMNKIDASQITDTRGMFKDCVSLKSIDLSCFNSSNLKFMAEMFSGCESLKKLDLKAIDTSKVVNFKEVFAGCIALKALDISNWDTRNAQNMEKMFARCQSLKNLDVSHFITENVTNMRQMFYNCELLKKIDVKNFNTSKVMNMAGMFAGCKSLKDLDLTKFITNNVKTMNGMFKNCWALKSLDLSSFYTKNVTDLSNMFKNCFALKSLDLSSFELNRIALKDKMVGIFENCNKKISVLGNDTFLKRKVFEILGAQNFVTKLSPSQIANQKARENAPGKVGVVYWKLDNDGVLHLSNHPKEGFDIINESSLAKNGHAPWSESALKIKSVSIDSKISPQTTAHWFDGCKNLQFVRNMKNLDASNVYSTNCMFRDCSSIEKIDLSHFNMPKLKIMSEMFKNCTNLKSLDFSCFKPAALTHMTECVKGCKKLEHLNFEGFKFNAIMTGGLNSIASYCNKLKDVIFDADVIADTKGQYANILLNNLDGNSDSFINRVQESELEQIQKPTFENQENQRKATKSKDRNENQKSDDTTR